MTTLNKRKRNTAILMLVITCLFVDQVMYSQFLLDNAKEEYTQPETDETEKKKESRGLPPHVARTIRAQQIEGVQGAVKITWDIHPDSTNDFIVGRTSSIPNNTKTALGAASVKLVPAGAKPVAIDSRLSPGQYYYVVLARKKIQAGDISLYPDVNYTGSPVVIEREYDQQQAKRDPDRVTLIHAREINKTQVLLTWKGVDQDNITYTIYRDAEPINTPEKIKRAKVVATVTGKRESYIDRGIRQTGKYYYAVTTKDMSGNEDLQLIPDQSYLTSGVHVVIKSSATVDDIQAKLLNDGTVKVTWDKSGLKAKEFLVYRYDEPLKNAERLALSRSLGTVDGRYDEFIDKNPPSGRLYYAVLIKMPDGAIDTNLSKDDNYTVQPVVMGKPVEVTGINATETGKGIRISWQYTGSAGSRYYKLYRAEEIPPSSKDIKDAYLVDIVNINSGSYVDSGVLPGSYYYALVPENFESIENFSLEKGTSICNEPVQVKKALKKLPEKKEPRPRKEFGKRIPDRVEPEPGRKASLSAPAVDLIVHTTFDRGYYRAAIKSLQKVIRESDNDHDVAKAKLFTGRSYIELKQYRKGLEYLVQNDVVKHFPEDAKFWRNYAIQRVGQ